MITRDEVLMGRDKDYPLTDELEANLKKLLDALNKFRAIYNKPMHVSSGYRPAAINSTVTNAAKKSKHTLCLACDFKDTDGKLDDFCYKNQDKLKECGLYLEHPDYTDGWCHLQVIPPKSGNRVFIP